MTVSQHQPPSSPGRLLTSGQVNPAVALRPGFDTIASREAMRWARNVLATAVPPLAGSLDQVVMLRDGHRRLALLELCDGRWLALKQYRDSQGAWTRKWLQRLTDAGFAPPARFAVTPARGWSGIHHTLVTDVAGGHPWTHWLRAPAAGCAAAVAAADWLIRLQSLSVTLPDRTRYRAGEQLRWQAGRLADQYPDHATRLLRVAETTHRLLHDNRQAAGPGLVPSHGDLHPENLHVTRGGSPTVTAIDVDTAGLRRPSYDVGYALAQLLVASWMRTGSFRPGAGAGLAFWRRWTAHNGTDADAVPAEVARTLMQSLHFELITYRTARTALLDRWLDIAEAVLADGLCAAFHTLTTVQEPVP
ncbi:aminoglycoside phosphotransferase family protein [Actinoplanes hulinensis]|uniref:Aminoglycoside phosphotransferase family protein n=1 Tax=Actinoplanes hulinensis TaxID=1144547 RepID=A0ABS7B8I4_9ACTN|nr:phosphotransferase [Actinoplanes hulinensis]MBW6437303.1 aminoglycoside phosphotransferase family protein [Actinoplanes hulinensis]MBW6437310.1 aminoglycoside phosphotransferase family protein [Actinoplanes hulinensis]